MKVKSFYSGLARGVVGAIARLDKQVEELGSGIVIHSLTDTYFNKEQTENEVNCPRSGLMVRVVIYADSTQ